MLVLIIGGSASGKSEIAESICQKLISGKKAYIATMAVNDIESEKRVLKHKEMRKDKGFDTFESPLCKDLNIADLGLYNTALLECISNLLANEMFIAKKNSIDANSYICSFIDKINKGIDNIIVVSNDVFGDYMDYDPFTREYLISLAKINKSIAKKANVVIECVCGIPVYIKGDRI